MAHQLACDINFFFYTRFILGFYHEFQTSERVKRLAKLYCGVVGISFVLLLNFLQFVSIYPKYLIYHASLEYLLYVLIALIKSNKYLLQYYKKMPLIDTSSSAYRPMRSWLIGCICVMTCVRFWGFIQSLVFQPEKPAIQHFFIFMDFITWFNILNGRAPLLFIFALLYSRLKLMRQTLERNNFDCRSQGNHHPRRYIQMYETIMDGLEKSNDSVKLQLFVFMLFSSSYYMSGTLCALYYMKIYGENVTNFQFMWFLTETILSSSPIFLSAILADLVSVEMQKMLVIVIIRRINCKNERDREEIQKLFWLLKSNPFKYRLWRVMPLNVRSLFSFISFTVTTTIAILQIHGWSA